MPVLLETERTYLRELTASDASHFYGLNNDPEVLRHTGDEPFASVEAARAFLEAYRPYQQFGVGRWAVIEKATEQWLGWCGLRYSESADEYDLGFRFFRHMWNKGFATETARACVHWGLNDHQLTEIVGRARTANASSIRVLEKAGLSFRQAIDWEGHPGVLYAVTRTP